MVAMSTARNESQTIITFLRSHRSTNAPAGNPSKTTGTARAAETRLATVGEPVRFSTSNG